MYHSIYDTHEWMRRFGDPGFHYHAAMARLWGLMALRLANADVLPFDYATYGRDILVYLEDVEALARARGVDVDLGEARAAAAAIAALPAAAPVPGHATDAAVRNAALMQAERDLLSRDGIPRPSLVPPPRLRTAAHLRGGDAAGSPRGDPGGRRGGRARAGGGPGRRVAAGGGDARGLDAVSMKLRSRWPSRLSKAAGTLVSRDIAVLTNAIAFNFLLCLFPLLLVVAAVSQQLPGGRRAGTALLLLLDELIPFGHEAMAPALRNLNKMAKGLEIVSLALIVWGSSGIFMPVEMALNRAWGGRPHRHFWRSRMLAVLMTLAGGLLALCSVALTLAAREWAQELPALAAHGAKASRPLHELRALLPHLPFRARRRRCAPRWPRAPRSGAARPGSSRSISSSSSSPG